MWTLSLRHCSSTIYIISICILYNSKSIWDLLCIVYSVVFDAMLFRTTMSTHRQRTKKKIPKKKQHGMKPLMWLYGGVCNSDHIVAPIAPNEGRKHQQPNQPKLVYIFCCCCCCMYTASPGVRVPMKNNKKNRKKYIHSIVCLVHSCCFTVCGIANFNWPSLLWNNTNGTHDYGTNIPRTYGSCAVPQAQTQALNYLMVS